MSKFTIEPWASVEIPTNGGNGETFVEIKNPDAVEDGEVVIDVVGWRLRQEDGVARPQGLRRRYRPISPTGGRQA